MRKFILDEEIDLQEKGGECGKENVDLLHAMDYVDTLMESVMNAPEEKAFNIGLFGEWGSGKSSIIKTFKRKIEENSKKENRCVKVITYDAWKYANDSFRRMFLLQMQAALGFERDNLMNKFYLNSSEDVHVDTRFDRKELGTGVIVLLLMYVGITQFTNFSVDGKILATAIVSMTLLVYTILRGLMKEVKVNIQRPHLFAPEQFEDCFNEMCDLAHQSNNKPLKFLRWIKGQKGVRGIKRLVIVIDNVDRCSSNLAYELLTNIKNFLGCKHNTIFIVPVDEDALKRHFEQAKNKQEHDADEFLRKFFNICIRIKLFKRDEMYDFADALNKKHQLKYTPTTVSLVANEFAHNPRRIIQMFNNLNVELQCLPKIYDEKHQPLVCLLLILREEYPEYYLKVQDDVGKLFKSSTINDDKTGVKIFLSQNSAVIAPYDNDFEMIERLLSNSSVEDRIPKVLRDDYLNMSYGEESRKLMADDQHRRELIHYVEGKLKLSIKRLLWDTDVKNTIDRLIALNETVNLFRDENLRLAGMMTSGDTFKEIAARQQNLHKLIDYAAYMESQGIDLVGGKLANYIQEKGIEEEEYNIQVDVWYACYKLNISDLKKFAKVCVAACKKDMMSLISYDYDIEKSKEVFSDELIAYLLSEMKSEKDKVVKLMKYIVSKITLSSMNLVAFVKALTEVTPKYDFRQNNTGELLKRMEEINEILNKCQIIRLKNDDVKCIKDFYKTYETVIMDTRSGRSVQRSYILENLNNSETMDVLLHFFRYASIITQEEIVKPNTLKMLLESKNYNAQILDILTDIHKAGYPVEKYCMPLSELNIVTDKKALALLDHILKVRNEDGTYAVDDGNVKRVIEMLLEIVKVKDDVKTNYIIDAIRSLVEDERNSRVMEEIFVGKDKEWLLSLPVELMQYAIKVFESHIDDYEDQQNVLMLLAAQGSSRTKKFIVGIAIAKINNNMERKTGMEIICSFEGLTDRDANPLITSLEFIKENNPEEAEAVDECLKKLDSTLKKV